MFTIILAGGFWTMFCSWVFWMALLAIGAFILGWLFRTPRIEEWKHKYEAEVSSNAGFAKKYAKLEKNSASFNKEKTSLEKTIAKQKSELSNLKNANVKLENDLRTTTRENTSITNKLGLLNNEIAGFKSGSEVDTSVEHTDENAKEVDRLTDILNSRDREIERLKASTAETKAEKDEYIRRSESYRPRFEEANLERNTLKVKYDKLVETQKAKASGESELAIENKKMKEELARLKGDSVDTSDDDKQNEIDSLIRVAKKTEAEKNDLKIKYESLLRHTEELEAAKKSNPSTSAPLQAFAAAVTPPTVPTPVATPPVAAITPNPAVETAEDDLKKIEGIGPKIEELIKNGGIKTWAALAATDPSVIQSFLDQAGPRYKMHVPQSWPLQAGMAARGEWEALEKWQDEHDNGKM